LLADVFTIENLLIRLPVVLLALTVHEFCHAYFAYRMGDPTAAQHGRCTLNPFPHLDPLGTIMLMFAPIGWAKPVPVNPMNFHNRRKGELVTTAAGPLSNLALACVFALVMRGILYCDFHYPDLMSDRAFEVLTTMTLFGVIINTALMVFNFLPIYPLDGYHIAYNLMRSETQQRFAEMRAYGPFLILGLVLLENFSEVGILSRIILPPAGLLFKYVAGIPGL
jgi:Zn-dependent protease